MIWQVLGAALEAAASMDFAAGLKNAMGKARYPC